MLKKEKKIASGAPNYISKAPVDVIYILPVSISSMPQPIIKLVRREGPQKKITLPRKCSIMPGDYVLVQKVDLNKILIEGGTAANASGSE